MCEGTKDYISWEEAVRWLVEHPEQTKRDLARACYFDGRALEAAKRFADSPEWEGVRELLPSPPGRALDIGAGRGISSYALARDGWIVTAVEPDPSDLIGRGAIHQIAAESCLPIDPVGATAEALPFNNGTFDVVHCRQALHHASDLQKMCAEAIRVLRPGGTFIATREHVISRRADLQGFLDRHALHFLYGGEHAYTLSEYHEALTAAKAKDIKSLGPWSSVINIFPATFEAELQRMAAKVGVPATDLPDYVFKLREAYDDTPGRLYTFLATK